MKKKKVDKILKGVLTVGTVIGGANVMSDADLVYAAENEIPRPSDDIIIPDSDVSSASNEQLVADNAAGLDNGFYDLGLSSGDAQVPSENPGDGASENPS